LSFKLKINFLTLALIEFQMRREELCLVWCE